MARRKDHSREEIREMALGGHPWGICILALSGNLDIAGVDSVAYLTPSLMNSYSEDYMAAQTTATPSERQTYGERHGNQRLTVSHAHFPIAFTNNKGTKSWTSFSD